MNIDMSSVLRRNTDILYAPVGSDEAVMMSVDAGKYFGLNAVGVRIWELLDSPKSINDLCKIICDEFDVDTKTCTDEVVKFATSLVGNGIVDVSAAEHAQRNLRIDTT